MMRFSAAILAAVLCGNVLCAFDLQAVTPNIPPTAGPELQSAPQTCTLKIEGMT